MKKVFSLLLAVLMLVSALPVAYATDTVETADYTAGTAVVYTAPNSEGWTVTVPAKLAPGGSGPVTLEGYWPGNKQITVTAQDNVVLTNSINAANQKSLDISFVGISELGSNTERQEFTEYVSVEPIANALFGIWNGVFYYNVGSQELDTIEQLQATHDFEYYSTMNLAVTDVNNGAIGASADIAEEDKADAVAGIYTDEGNTYVVLLKDTTEAETVKPSVDMNINLGGYTLSANDAVCINVLGGSVTIDGRLSGSSVSISSSSTGITAAIQSGTSSNVIVQGGTYICENYSGGYGLCVYGTGEISVTGCDITANTSSGTASGVYVESTANVSNCNISTSSNATAQAITVGRPSNATITNCNLKATGTEGATIGLMNYGAAAVTNCDITTTATDGYSRGVSNKGTVTVTNCDITATATDGCSNGVFNNGVTATITNCDIRAYANYDSDETEYTAYSVGISNNSSLTLNDCYVMGTHSGVSSPGTLYVNGGTYEGYGHGGFYFSGADTTSYVRNATIRQCTMPDGYTATANCNGSGFYIGSAAGNDNISVYMDNCDIYGSVQPIVFRGTDGEQNNSLYISNSTISGAMKIRIDNNTHKLYIGTGNNFTAENTTLAEAVVVTDETYIYNG